MNTIETTITFNGNNQLREKPLPLLCILVDHFNPEALDWVEKNTGLRFKENFKNNWEAQPETSAQIVRLLLTYNFKTQYHDNDTTRNTILLKLCDPNGFRVQSICFECIKRNSIYTHTLKQGDYLSC